MDYNKFTITKTQKEGNVVTFFTECDATLQIRLISDKVVQIFGNYDGKAIKAESYSVETIPQKDVVYTFTAHEGYYLISTKILIVKIFQKNIHLEYYRQSDKQLITKDNGMTYGEDGVGLSHIMAKDEHFYGLGEDNDGYLGSLDRRGTTRDMITGQRINTGCVTADFPVTFFMSSGGTFDLDGNKCMPQPYGMFVDNSYRMLFDMGKSNENEYSWKANGGDLLYYFFIGDNYSDILDSYTMLTGRPSMPPLWILGYTQCKCSYYAWDEIDEIIANLKEKRVPLDCIVFDGGWADYYQNFTWGANWEGKSHQKIAEHRAEGLHFMASNYGPMIKSDAKNYQRAVEADVLAKDKDGNTVVCGHFGGELLDFTSPKLLPWARPQLESILDDGIEAWWLDLGEPEGDPDGTQYYGGDKSKVHNPFCLMNVKTFYDVTMDYIPNKRPFILSRTGIAGIQKYSTAVWSGDVFSDYKTFTAHIPEAMNTGMSGIPMWTNDSGGFISSTNCKSFDHNMYNNDPAAHAKLYERWMQFSCFCPITRAHHAGQSAPFVFGDLMTDGMAHYVRLRYQLIPYIYSYYAIAHAHGTPIMRPLVFSYPHDEAVYNLKDEYLFGEELLVSPVIEENVSYREVYLPEGEWFDYDYHYQYEGGKSYHIYAPQNRIPVFVKRGAIIPMVYQAYTTEAIDFNSIILDIYPLGKTSFTLYRDDGVTFDNDDGKFTETKITCSEDIGKKTEISINVTNNLYSAHQYMVKLHVNAIPVSVTANSSNLPKFGFLRNLENSPTSGYYYDYFNTILYVKIYQEDTVSIYYDGKIIPARVEKDEKDCASGRQPYLFPPSVVPCKVQCENFDRGGQDIGFHKNTVGNSSKIYRDDDVEISVCDDIGGGYYLNGLVFNEWAEYSIDCLESGDFIFEIRGKGNVKFNISINSQIQSGRLTLDSAEWTTIETVPIHLTQGIQLVKVYVNEGTLDINYINIKRN